MNNWKGKIAVVTGASGGIGSAVLQDFVKAGIITVGLSPDFERIEQLKCELGADGSNLHSFKCDVTDEQNVKDVFSAIQMQFGYVNILVNCAGLLKKTPLLTESASNEDIKDIVGVNILGLMYCTREAYKHLRISGDYGYIINLSSVVGHNVPLIPDTEPFYNLYPATKHAVTATTEVLRQELVYHKLDKIRVSSISPGLVDTNIFGVAGITTFDTSGMSKLKPVDISASIMYLLSTPYHVNVKDIIIKSVGEQF